jgi:hypothetical protein
MSGSVVLTRLQPLTRPRRLRDAELCAMILCLAVGCDRNAMRLRASLEPEIAVAEIEMFYAIHVSRLTCRICRLLFNL